MSELSRSGATDVARQEKTWLLQLGLVVRCGVVVGDTLWSGRAKSGSRVYEKRERLRRPRGETPLAEVDCDRGHAPSPRPPVRRRPSFSPVSGGVRVLGSSHAGTYVGLVRFACFLLSWDGACPKRAFFSRPSRQNASGVSWSWDALSHRIESA